MEHPSGAPEHDDVGAVNRNSSHDSFASSDESPNSARSEEHSQADAPATTNSPSSGERRDAPPLNRFTDAGPVTDSDSDSEAEDDHDTSPRTGNRTTRQAD